MLRISGLYCPRRLAAGRMSRNASENLIVLSRKNRGLRLHTYGMRLAYSDFYDFEKCVRVIFYAVRRYYIAPLRLVQIFHLRFAHR